MEIVAWQQTPCAATASTLLNQYLMLSKIRLTTLVVITTMVGYAMAPAPFVAETFLYCTIGTGLCSAAANAINQYHEVPFDAQMSRTKNRVLVRGQLTPLHAINFAVASATIGTCLLHFGVNDYAAALGLGNLLLYTSVYTPMKRVSIMNTWVGSVGEWLFSIFFLKQSKDSKWRLIKFELFLCSGGTSASHRMGWLQWSLRTRQFTIGRNIVYMAVSSFQCLVMEFETRLFTRWLSNDGRITSSVMPTCSSEAHHCFRSFICHVTTSRCYQYLVRSGNVAIECLFRLLRWDTYI